MFACLWPGRRSAGRRRGIIARWSRAVEDGRPGRGRGARGLGRGRESTVQGQAAHSRARDAARRDCDKKHRDRDGLMRDGGGGPGPHGGMDATSPARPEAHLSLQPPCLPLPLLGHPTPTRLSPSPSVRYPVLRPTPHRAHVHVVQSARQRTKPPSGQEKSTRASTRHLHIQ